MFRKWIVATMGALAASLAYAGWEPIAELAAVQFFWDSKDVRKSGAMVKVWVLTEHKAPQKNSVDGSVYRSSKSQYEIDCKKDLLRGLSQSQHAASAAQGEATYTINGASPWEPVPPGSVFSVLAKKVCSPARQP